MLKRMLFLVLVSVICVMCVVYTASAIDTKSIVAIWLCDEGTGNALADASGNKHDGKMVGDIKWADGKYGKALEFPGKSGTRVEVPDDADLTLAEWTITAWAKLNPPPGGDWAVIVVKDPANGIQNYALDLDTPGTVCAEVTSAGNWSGCSSTITIYDDEWHFTAASYDGTTLRVYVDEKKEGEQAFGKPDVNTAPITIGGRLDGSQPLLGLIDDIGLFNVALGNADLKTIMDKGLGDALGFTPVEPISKLTTTWGQVKQR